MFLVIPQLVSLVSLASFQSNLSFLFSLCHRIWVQYLREPVLLGNLLQRYDNLLIAHFRRVAFDFLVGKSGAGVPQANH